MKRDGVGWEGSTWETVGAGGHSVCLPPPSSPSPTSLSENSLDRLILQAHHLHTHTDG